MSYLPHLHTGYYPSLHLDTSSEPKSATSSEDSEPSHPTIPQDSNAVPSAPSKINVDLIPRPMMRHDHMYGVYKPDIDKTPPHVYANFRIEPGCVSSPRHLRLTCHHIGTDAATQDVSGLPIACVWQPFADLPVEESIPVVEEVSRCANCLAYASPFFEVLDAGYRFKCNLCDTLQATSETCIRRPGPYLEREIGTYDIPAPASYYTGVSAHMTFVICVDVTLLGVNQGLYSTVFSTVSDSLEFLPDPEHTSFMFFTFDDTLKAYRNTDATLSEVISLDALDLFIADAPAALSFPASDPSLKAKLDYLAEAPRSKLTKSVVSIGSLVAAFTAVLDPGSRLLLFTSLFGTLGQYGLTPRDDVHLHNSEKESVLLKPQREMSTLGIETGKAGIAVDLFVCSGGYMDLASLSSLTSVTGGDLHYYPGFQQVPDNDKLRYQLLRTLTRPQVFQTLMKVRCGYSLNVTQIIGNYIRKSPSEIEVPILDCDKTITVVFEHDKKMKSGSLHPIQLAFLYTNALGNKFTRVFNAMFRATISLSKSHPAEIIHSADVDTVINVQLKQHVEHLKHTTVQLERASWHQRLAKQLCEYREIMSRGDDMTQLILPEALKLLPLLSLTSMKLPALSLSRTNPELRVAWMHRIRGMSVKESFLVLYPRVYRIDNLLEQLNQPGGSETIDNLPDLVPSSVSKIQSECAYFLDNGDVLGLLVGPKVVPEFLHNVLATQVFGVDTYEELKSITGKHVYLSLQTELNTRLNHVVSTIIKKNCGKYQSIFLLQDHDLRSQFLLKSVLLEDGTPSEMAYPEFLLNLHRMVISNLGL